jgi:hypothetical protein
LRLPVEREVDNNFERVASLVNYRHLSSLWVLPHNSRFCRGCHARECRRDALR